MSALALITDPSTFGWPPGLPFELALRQAKPSEVCASYGLAKSDYDRLKMDPTFIAALEEAVQMVQKEGVTFRKKAQVQAEELLKTSWALIHETFENVPAKVKADLIMWTQRIAGYDASLDQKALAQASAVQQNALQIIINLGDA